MELKPPGLCPRAERYTPGRHSWCCLQQDDAAPSPRSADLPGAKSMWSCSWQLDLPQGMILARLIIPPSLLNAFSPHSDVWHTWSLPKHKLSLWHCKVFGVVFSQLYLLQNACNEFRFADSSPSLGFLGGCWDWALAAGSLTTPWGPSGKSHKESLPVKNKKKKKIKKGDLCLL